MTKSIRPITINILKITQKVLQKTNVNINNNKLAYDNKVDINTIQIYIFKLNYKFI